MGASFFKGFKTIQYANNQAINLLERVYVPSSVVDNPYLYYPQDLTDGVRADQVANQYYGDPFKSWILYLSNGIIDPYYQWYLQPDQFVAFLEAKYSLPITTLQQTVIFYRNNWYAGNDQISVSAYDALDYDLLRFWEPVYNNTAEPVYYQRVQVDWTISTNKVISYEGNNFSSLVNNEIVTVNYPNFQETGQGQVVFSSNASALIQHVSGVPIANAVASEQYMYGTQSGANLTFSSVSLIANNIPDIEAAYWDSVYVYDYENEKNEMRRTIRVLNPSYTPTAVSELAALLAS